MHTHLFTHTVVRSEWVNRRCAWCPTPKPIFALNTALSKCSRRCSSVWLWICYMRSAFVCWLPACCMLESSWWLCACKWHTTADAGAESRNQRQCLHIQPMCAILQLPCVLPIWPRDICYSWNALVKCFSTALLVLLQQWVKNAKCGRVLSSCRGTKGVAIAIANK